MWPTSNYSRCTITESPRCQPVIPAGLGVRPEVAITLKEKLPAFPEGAVIVNEKLTEKDGVIGGGGMIKRAAGFDAKNGDWAYFYAEKGGGFSSGHLQNCADCHAGA